jgi:hypothetical protein
MPFVISIIIGTTCVSKLDELQKWILKAQAKMLYEARASNWGSPNVLRGINQNDN